jgi:hypothetical protein
MSKKDSKAVQETNMIQAKESELRRLFGVRHFDYVPEDNPDELQPVRIEILPFFASRFTEISDAVIDLAVKHYLQNLQTGVLVMSAVEQVFTILDPFVRVPTAESLRVRDLPIDCVIECLSHFVKGISPGKWKALGGQILGTFGLGGLFEDVRRGLMSEAQDSKPSTESETGSETLKTQSEEPAQS